MIVLAKNGFLVLKWRVPVCMRDNHRCVADRCLSRGEEGDRVIAIRRWAQWCVCSRGNRECLVMGTLKRKIRWEIERMGTEEESDADMTRPKSEGRPNYCSPRCPTLIILSLLSPPTLTVSISCYAIPIICYNYVLPASHIFLFLFYFLLFSQNAHHVFFWIKTNHIISCRSLRLWPPLNLWPCHYHQC